MIRNQVLSAVLTTAVFLISGSALADAELRLYSGNYEWDLKDKILIQSQDGHSFDQQFKKVCDAFAGCKAVRTNSDQEAQLSNIGSSDLASLNIAIEKAVAGGDKVEATPAKPALCAQFPRFVYEVKDTTGKSVLTEEIRACKGTRLQGADALLIERVLNIAAGFAGL